MSPTTTLCSADDPLTPGAADVVGEGCTRGAGRWVGREGCYTGYYPGTVPGPIFSHILAMRPYLRPNEGNSGHYDEVSQIWSRIDLRIDLRMDPE